MLHVNLIRLGLIGDFEIHYQNLRQDCHQTSNKLHWGNGPRLDTRPALQNYIWQDISYNTKCLFLLHLHFLFCNKRDKLSNWDFCSGPVWHSGCVKINTFCVCEQSPDTNETEFVKLMTSPRSGAWAACLCCRLQIIISFSHAPISRKITWDQSQVLCFVYWDLQCRDPWVK